jgi:hypothetical protein
MSTHEAAGCYEAWEILQTAYGKKHYPTVLEHIAAHILAHAFNHAAPGHHVFAVLSLPSENSEDLLPFMWNEFKDGRYKDSFEALLRNVLHKTPQALPEYHDPQDWDPSILTEDYISRLIDEVLDLRWTDFEEVEAFTKGPVIIAYLMMFQMRSFDHFLHHGGTSQWVSDLQDKLVFLTEALGEEPFHFKVFKEHTDMYQELTCEVFTRMDAKSYKFPFDLPLYQFIKKS